MLAAIAVAPPSAWARTDDEFFESKIRPILVQNCFECHSESAGTTKGGLALDSRPGWERGGESGPVIVPGHSADSLLVKAVRYTHPDVHMPPRGKLPDPEIDDLEKWIAMGAPDPRDKAPEFRSTSSPSAPRKIDLVAGRQHWAFRPIADPTPPSLANGAAASRVRDPIDRFVIDRLEKSGIAVPNDCDRRTWLRRVTLDLTGLPPTPEECAAFLKDEAPDAFERVVDRLLASPQYGERFARFWLDLVRYSDSNGVDENLAYSLAYRYRDYVVQSFNDDKPYDRFITEQLAGDLLPEPSQSASGSSVDTKQLREQLAATGFLVLGPKMLAEQDKEKLVIDTVDEQIDVVSKTFLGVTLACARCHDHKFDPFTQRDYYALGGIFRSTSTFDDLGFLSRWRERELATTGAIAARDAWRKERGDADGALQHLRGEARTNRELALLRGLGKAIEAVADAASHAVVLDAEKFASSNLRIDHEQFGNADVGFIHTHQAGQQFAEYAIDLPAPGRYALEIRYASGESRPIRVFADGAPIAERALEVATGGFKSEHRQWATVGSFEAAATRVTLRLERIPNEPQHFPHVNTLLLHPETKGGESWPASNSNGLDPSLLRSTAEWLARGGADKARAIELSKRVETALAAQTPAQADEAKKALLADASYQEAVKSLISERGPIGKSQVEDPSAFLAKEREDIDKAVAVLAGIDARKPPEFDRVMGVKDDKVVELPVHIRGSHLNKEATAQSRAVPAVFADLATLEPIPEGQSGRLQFAHWLTSKDNPLTSRVIANRLWQFHFGSGLSHTPSNFGFRGEEPSDPALLDYLARELMRSGWSLKAVHRRIVLSTTYRAAPTASKESLEKDVDDRMLSRFPRRRMDAEQIRDSMLAIAGTLDRTIGGTVLKTNDRDYVTNDQSADRGEYVIPRRTLYLPVIRNAMYEFLSTFDYADPSVPLDQRPQSVIASQALWLMNSPFAIEQSMALAKSIFAANEDRDARIALAFQRILLRDPTSVERDRIVRYLDSVASSLPAQDDRPLHAFATFCQALFASSEFVYVD